MLTVADNYGTLYSRAIIGRYHAMIPPNNSGKSRLCRVVSVVGCVSWFPSVIGEL